MKEITSEEALAYVRSLPEITWTDDPDWYPQLEEQDKQIYFVARHLFKRLDLRNAGDFLRQIFFDSESIKERDFHYFRSCIREGHRVADIGCGWGGLTRRLKVLTRNIVAVDYVLEHVIATKLRNPEARVFQADVRSLPLLPDAGVDVVILHDVLEHIGNTENPCGASGRNILEQFSALQELSRILCDQGMIYLSTGNYLFPRDGETNLWFYHWLPAQDKNIYNRQAGISSDRYWLLTWEEMQPLLSSCGFTLESVTSPNTDSWNDMFLDRLELCFRDLHPEMKNAWKRLVSTDPRFFSSWRILARKQKKNTGTASSGPQMPFLPPTAVAQTASLLSAMIENRIPHPLERMLEYLGGRPVWIWGAGMSGERILTFLNRAKIPVCGFLDSNPQKQGKQLLERPIRNPMEILQDRHEDPFVFIGSIYYAEIEKRLQELGFRYWSDYLTLVLS